MIMDPGMDGLQTFEEINRRYPDQKVIIASGYSESDRVKTAQLLGAGDYIKKPYTLESIGIAVRKELDKKKSLLNHFFFSMGEDIIEALS
jgi:YesN/AraC family two-component response regulator